MQDLERPTSLRPFERELFSFTSNSAIETALKARSFLDTGEHNRAQGEDCQQVPVRHGGGGVPDTRAGGVPAQDPRHHVRGRVQPVVHPRPGVPQFIHRYFRKDATETLREGFNYVFHALRMYYLSTFWPAVFYKDKP